MGSDCDTCDSCQAPSPTPVTTVSTTKTTATTEVIFEKYVGLVFLANDCSLYRRWSIRTAATFTKMLIATNNERLYRGSTFSLSSSPCGVCTLAPAHIYAKWNQHSAVRILWAVRSRPL